MKNLVNGLLAVAILASAPMRSNAQPSVEMIPTGFLIPQGVSDDGNVVVGQCGYCAQQMFKWTSGGPLQSLGCPTGTSCWGPTPGQGRVAMNADGSVIVGTIRSGASATGHACRWTSQSIDATFADALGFAASTATGVSADGNAACGDGLVSASHAYHWSALHGPREITPTGVAESSCNAISADGRTVAGIAYIQSVGFRPFRWTTTGGWRDLGELPNLRHGGGLGVSRNGAVVAGNAVDVDGRTRVFRWTAAEGLSDIGSVPGETGASFIAMTSNGEAIVARGGSTSTGFLWRVGQPNVLLTEYLLAQGVSIEGAFGLTVSAMSPSGSAMVLGGYRGEGYDGTVPRSWVVRGLPPLVANTAICAADIDSSGDLAVGDIFAFVGAWFDADPRADFDSSESVTVDDLFDFVNAWLSGC